MPTLNDLADAIIRMEGSMLQNSVNMRMVREHGLWNVGHLVWAGQRGAQPVDINGRLWAGWPSYEESYEGLMRQIRLDASRGLTLEQFITKYAPPHENSTDNYIANVSAWTGIPPDTPLAALPGGVMPPLEYALAVFGSIPEDSGGGNEFQTAGIAGIAAIIIVAAAVGYVVLRGQDG